MERRELYHLCGITDLVGRTPKTEGKWMPGILKFMGAENYVLGTKSVEIRFDKRSGGLGLHTRERLLFNASDFLGKSLLPGKLFDVELHVGDVVISLASLTKVGTYPMVLRIDETVDLN